MMPGLESIKSLDVNLIGRRETLRIEYNLTLLEGAKERLCQLKTEKERNDILAR
jgi:hypothetical protein